MPPRCFLRRRLLAAGRHPRFVEHEPDGVAQLVPPDKREKATDTVLEQAEVLSAAWAEDKPPLPGFRPFPKRGGVVTDELIDRLREEVGD